MMVVRSDSIFGERSKKQKAMLNAAERLAGVAAPEKRKANGGKKRKRRKSSKTLLLATTSNATETIKAGGCSGAGPISLLAGYGSDSDET